MDARRYDRLILEETARLTPNDWSSAEICMLECTSRTFRAAGDVALRAGSPVTLEIPGIGPTRAYVTWQRADQFAATFAKPIDLSRARFMALNQEAVIARLLVERAAAQSAGRRKEERELRTRILRGLPVRKIVD